MKPITLPKSHRLAGCQGKHSFPTQAMAKRTADKATTPKRVYRCACCGAYHLGTGDDDIRKSYPRRKRLHLKGWQAEETIVRALRE